MSSHNPNEISQQQQNYQDGHYHRRRASSGDSVSLLTSPLSSGKALTGQQLMTPNASPGSLLPAKPLRSVPMSVLAASTEQPQVVYRRHTDLAAYPSQRHLTSSPHHLQNSNGASSSSTLPPQYPSSSTPLTSQPTQPSLTHMSSSTPNSSSSSLHFSYDPTAPHPHPHPHPQSHAPLPSRIPPSRSQTQERRVSDEQQHPQPQYSQGPPPPPNQISRHAPPPSYPHPHPHAQPQPQPQPAPPHAHPHPHPHPHPHSQSQSQSLSQSIPGMTPPRPPSAHAQPQYINHHHHPSAPGPPPSGPTPSQMTMAYPQHHHHSSLNPPPPPSRQQHSTIQGSAPPQTQSQTQSQSQFKAAAYPNGQGYPSQHQHQHHQHQQQHPPPPPQHQQHQQQHSSGGPPRPSSSASSHHSHSHPHSHHVSSRGDNPGMYPIDPNSSDQRMMHRQRRRTMDDVGGGSHSSGGGMRLAGDGVDGRGVPNVKQESIEPLIQLNQAHLPHRRTQDGGVMVVSSQGGPNPHPSSRHSSVSMGSKYDEPLHQVVSRFVMNPPNTFAPTTPSTAVATPGGAPINPAPLVTTLSSMALTPVQDLYAKAWGLTVSHVQQEMQKMYDGLTTLLEHERGQFVRCNDEKKGMEKLVDSLRDKLMLLEEENRRLRDVVRDLGGFGGEYPGQGEGGVGGGAGVMSVDSVAVKEESKRESMSVSPPMLQYVPQSGGMTEDAMARFKYELDEEKKKRLYAEEKLRQLRSITDSVLGASPIPINDSNVHQPRKLSSSSNSPSYPYSQDQSTSSTTAQRSPTRSDTLVVDTQPTDPNDIHQPRSMVTSVSPIELLKSGIMQHRQPVNNNPIERTRVNSFSLLPIAQSAPVSTSPDSPSVAACANMSNPSHNPNPNLNPAEFVPSSPPPSFLPISATVPRPDTVTIVIPGHSLTMSPESMGPISEAESDMNSGFAVLYRSPSPLVVDDDRGDPVIPSSRVELVEVKKEGEGSVSPNLTLMRMGTPRMAGVSPSASATATSTPSTTAMGSSSITPSSTTTTARSSTTPIPPPLRLPSRSSTEHGSTSSQVLPSPNGTLMSFVPTLSMPPPPRRTSHSHDDASQLNGVRLQHDNANANALQSNGVAQLPYDNAQHAYGVIPGGKPSPVSASSPSSASTSLFTPHERRDNVANLMRSTRTPAPAPKATPTHTRTRTPLSLSAPSPVPIPTSTTTSVTTTTASTTSPTTAAAPTTTSMAAAANGKKRTRTEYERENNNVDGMDVTMSSSTPGGGSLLEKPKSPVGIGVVEGGCPPKAKGDDGTSALKAVTGASTCRPGQQGPQLVGNPTLPLALRRARSGSCSEGGDSTGKTKEKVAREQRNGETKTKTGRVLEEGEMDVDEDTEAVVSTQTSKGVKSSQTLDPPKSTKREDVEMRDLREKQSVTEKEDKTKPGHEDRERGEKRPRLEERTVVNGEKENMGMKKASSTTPSSMPPTTNGNGAPNSSSSLPAKPPSHLPPPPTAPKASRVVSTNVTKPSSGPTSATTPTTPRNETNPSKINGTSTTTPTPTSSNSNSISNSGFARSKYPSSSGTTSNGSSSRNTSGSTSSRPASFSSFKAIPTNPASDYYRNNPGSGSTGFSTPGGPSSTSSSTTPTTGFGSSHRSFSGPSTTVGNATTTSNGSGNNKPSSESSSATRSTLPPNPSLPPKPAISIRHMDLLFDTKGDTLTCRFCLNRDPRDKPRPPSSSSSSDKSSSSSKPIPTKPATFSAKASWPELVGHCQSEHPKAFGELEKLSPAQVAERRQRTMASNSFGMGRGK